MKSWLVLAFTAALIAVIVPSAHAQQKDDSVAKDRRDRAEAWGWYTVGDIPKLKARAEQGNTAAQDCLGYFYETNGSNHSTSNLTEALKWYRRAADQDDAHGQIRVGDFYWYGYVVPQSFTEALKWYRRAADQGDANGQERLVNAERMAHDRLVGNIQLASGIGIGLFLVGLSFKKRKGLKRFVISNARQISLTVTAVALVGTWLYPPWVTSGGGYGDNHYWGCLFGTRQGTIDVQRLILLDLIVLTLGGSVVYALRSKALSYPATDEDERG